MTSLEAENRPVQVNSMEEVEIVSFNSQHCFISKRAADCPACLDVAATTAALRDAGSAGPQIFTSILMELHMVTMWIIMAMFQ